MATPTTRLAAFVIPLLALAAPHVARAAEIQLNGGTIHIEGENFDEDIYIYEQQSMAWFNIGTGQGSSGGTQIVVWIVDNRGKTLNYVSFPKSDVYHCMVYCNEGDDFVDARTDIRMSIFGGPGIDELHGGSNDDHLDGGSGLEDYLYGHDGRDTLVSGREKRSSMMWLNEMSYLDGGRDKDLFLYRASDLLVLDGLGTRAGFHVKPNGRNWYDMWRYSE
ncbi:MAG: hypothetical protein KDA37_04240 [Planctomycetales bacterium]|nr:hypothetical protein [Planctomycetales bacterium]